MVQSDFSNNDGTEVPDMAVTDMAPTTAPEPTIPLDTAAPAVSESLLEPGTQVEVRRKFDSKWSRGFVISASTSDGYVVRRPSDGEELPVIIAADDVRKERKNNTWWY